MKLKWFRESQLVQDGFGQTGGRNPVGVDGLVELLSQGSPASDTGQPLGFGAQSLWDGTLHEPTAPHPNPLPSEGRGDSLVRDAGSN